MCQESMDYEERIKNLEKKLEEYQKRLESLEKDFNYHKRVDLFSFMVDTEYEKKEVNSNK